MLHKQASVAFCSVACCLCSKGDREGLYRARERERERERVRESERQREKVSVCSLCSTC